MVTDRFPVTFDGAQPPWAALVQNLTQRIGVEEVKVVEEIHLRAESADRGRAKRDPPRRAVRTRAPRDIQPVERERQGPGRHHHCLGLCRTSRRKGSAAWADKSLFHVT